MNMKNFDSYFKSAFTVDNVIFGFDEGDLKVLLIKRQEEPYYGHWALPGYFVRSNEEKMIRPQLLRNFVACWCFSIDVHYNFDL